MQIHIVHQSSTGNTLLGAQTMAAELEAAGHACSLARARDANEAQLANADMVGIATAVYAFAPARNMLSFLRAMPELPGKPAFVLCCCSAVPSNSVRTVWRALERKGLRVLGGHVLIGEDSWPCLRFRFFTPGRGQPSPEGLGRTREFARRIIDLADDPAAGTIRPPLWLPSLFHLIGLMAGPRLLRMGMLGKRVDADRCTRCGKCAEVCPTGAITMEDLPVFSGDCMGCFGCINNCPEQAISCPMSWGRRLYRGPKHAADSGS